VILVSILVNRKVHGETIDDFIELHLPLKKLARARNSHLESYTYQPFEYTAKDDEPMPILCPPKPSPHTYQVTEVMASFMADV
jgi:hypothetical protein